MTSTLDHINAKLQNVPQDILERVLGYVEGLLERRDFEVTEEMKTEMRAIAARPVSEHFSEEEVEGEIMHKYGI